MCGHTRNEVVHNKVGVAPIENKMYEAQLSWLSYVTRKPMDAHGSRVNGIE